MGLLRDKNGNNISVATVNGYTKENVIKAKQYLREIGSNRRGFPVERLVEMYNDIKGTKESAKGCKPCAMTKYYNGIQNHAYFGELTLINNGKATKEELDIDNIKEEIDEEPIAEETKEEDKKPETDIKEKMAKVRAHRKINKKQND